jgi:hypothetical protein
MLIVMFLLAHQRCTLSLGDARRTLGQASLGRRTQPRREAASVNFMETFLNLSTYP